MSVMTSTRRTLTAQLSAQRFDVLVVGGGIVGAGIARDASMRGLKVALVEQDDFAGGTSSKTSKLIHGGLRYLEHGHLRLVYESLHERQTLRSIAPAYVHPISLLLPVYAGDARASWTINVGLWLYDLLAGRRNIRSHRMLSVRRTLALEPRLRVDGLRAAGLYADCQMDDARLCLLNVLQAIQFGAFCANYLRVETFMKTHERVCGVVATDVFTGGSIEIQADVVINATGPWSDRVRRLSDTAAERRLAPTKGAHLILPRLAQEPLFVQARDRRMIFLLPWGAEYTLVGTTESPVDQPLDQLTANREEAGYLLEQIARILPGSHIDEENVIASFAGARPLLDFSGSSTQASREHRIEVDRRGLISILGGKYTTYRLMAQQVVDLVLAQRRWRSERCLTDQVSLLETIQPISLERWSDVTRRVDPDLLAGLLTRYGAGAFDVLQVLEQEPALARPVCPHHEYCAAELVHAHRREFGWTITDILARRTRIAWSSCQGLDALSTVADVLERYGGLSRDAIERQIEAYHHFLASSVAFRSADVTSRMTASRPA
ncbi:MAG: glycerol-3-phosphate dehydrogenase/oxidase [Candidatus Omnitrophica bacterium]|nr:glycerol-3-phosphate dehydrogenase/oxidase [Candidatus Omnitrophota bacterium]